VQRAGRIAEGVALHGADAGGGPQDALGSAGGEAAIAFERDGGFVIREGYRQSVEEYTRRRHEARD